MGTEKNADYVKIFTEEVSTMRCKEITKKVKVVYFTTLDGLVFRVPMQDIEYCGKLFSPTKENDYVVIFTNKINNVCVGKADSIAEVNLDCGL